VLDAPAASHAKNRKHTSIVTTGSPDSPGIPARNGFNGLPRDLPGDRALLSPSSADTSRRLDASVEASEPHDFAVRSGAVRQQHVSVHRIPPRVRDDRDRPSMGRDGGACKSDLGPTGTEMFLQTGLDRPNHVDPVQQNGFWEISLPSPASACPLTWQIDTLHLSRSNAGTPGAHAFATTRR
jgi:hypothetical protein